MCGFIFDPSKTNLRKTLKEYEELALRYIWETGDEGAGSGLTWRAVNERLEEGKTISRASIIFFLNRMLDQDVLSWRDATGKGGHHKIYITKLDESGYKKYVVRTLLESVAKDYPKETEEVLKSFLK
jgi:predicted transcriptional regulator